MTGHIPRRFHEYFETDLDIYFTTNENGENLPAMSLAWWRVQCELRSVDTHGTIEVLQARLQRRNKAHDDRARILRHSLETDDTYVTVEGVIDRAVEAIAQRATHRPVVFKVGYELRLPLNRACEARALKHRQVKKPDQCIDSFCFVVVGKDRARVVELVRWLVIPDKQEHEAAFEILRKKRLLEIERETRRQEEAQAELERQQAVMEADNAEVRQRELALDEARQATPERLEQIKAQFLMFGQECFDPDADDYIPNDPTKKSRGNTFHAEKLKAWWQAQCYFRELDIEGTVLALIDRLRTRDRDEDPVWLPILTELYEVIRNAEWSRMSDEQKVQVDIRRLLRESAHTGLILRLDKYSRQDVHIECDSTRPDLTHMSVDLPVCLRRLPPYSDRWLVVARNERLANQLRNYVRYATEDDLEPDDISAIPRVTLQLHAGLSIFGQHRCARLRRDADGAVPAQTLKRIQASQPINMTEALISGDPAMIAAARKQRDRHGFLLV